LNAFSIKRNTSSKSNKKFKVLTQNSISTLKAKNYNEISESSVENHNHHRKLRMRYSEIQIQLPKINRKLMKSPLKKKPKTESLQC